MPRPRKKTPLDPPPPLPSDSKELTESPESSRPLSEPDTAKQGPLSRPPFLTLEEKRKWLARILRDTSGQHQGFELSLGDKFKALVEDNKLAGHLDSPEEENKAAAPSPAQNLPELLRALLGTVPPPQEQHFRPRS